MFNEYAVAYVHQVETLEAELLALGFTRDQIVAMVDEAMVATNRTRVEVMATLIKVVTATPGTR